VLFFSFILSSAKCDLHLSNIAIYIHEKDETSKMKMKFYFSSKSMNIHPKKSGTIPRYYRSLLAGSANK
jgi:hypothetical protein